ncbi:MAG: alpha-amylase family glycosyl hydrolase [Anaerolineaceae bacterium]
MMEFHISRAARDLYHFDEDLFSFSGNVILANFQAVRQFAYQMNLHKERAKSPTRGMKVGDINAMGMIDEILHLVVELYRQQIDPQITQKALRFFSKQMGQKELDQVLTRFIHEFPSVPVYRGIVEVNSYLNGVSGDRTNREIILEEILLLWLANVNPAFSPYNELFDDSGLRKETPYLILIDNFFTFFDKQPFFGPDHQNLIAMLRAPAVAAPQSLQGQLEFIRTHWAALLGDYLQRLLGSLDFLGEQEKAFIPGGPGPNLVYQFGQMDAESEMFSRDSDWMPNCVLIAKNTYVWLDQLSRKYQRQIYRLDQIPDEELERLARLGMNGLWLIGLWERSRASQRIKQLCGNSDAVASAYSLADYAIAGDLGGDPAYQILRYKASRYGIRLASDMVPNHMGIDSGWVIEHPDWFLSLEHSPFPSYTFNGPDLSTDGRAGLFLEDHYYTRNDASVVFKRIDRPGGREQYIYHGNDGTNMPWNDTAQLNYLNPQVREVVIQTILSVARRFPIIRFDAAMTLAKKHFQRLWFPEPGSGGAIPTRAEFGMTKSNFDRIMPQEFWREVVDRVAREAPDTLLLAEAFWMMEGFFVRTLGMHRVYNSAFMNMLRDEENASYRLVIKNTLEFDPQILKRYVNFMNNPDEKTAIEQFGKGDKYFGICTLLATMPGLPMFGHGQIEGFAEKYGMEYRRALLDEGIDDTLVERHHREISPLLHRRYLYSEVDHFLLYDFYMDTGQVNEDVFAYSNQADGEHSLVLYNNRFNHASGWIKRSASYTRKSGSSKRLVHTDVGEGLGLGHRANSYVIFRDQNSNLEYIQNCQGVHKQGLHFELGAYQNQVLLSFREVTSNNQHDYARLESYLGSRGVSSIDDALGELALLPVLNPYRAISNADVLQRLLNARPGKGIGYHSPEHAKSVRQDYLSFLNAVAQRSGGITSINQKVDEAIKRIGIILSLPTLSKTHAIPASRQFIPAAKYISSLPRDEYGDWLGLLHWVYLTPLVEANDSANHPDQGIRFLGDLHLSQELITSFRNCGLNDENARLLQNLVLGMLALQSWRTRTKSQSMVELFTWVFQDPHLSAYLKINTFNGILWFDQKAFKRLIWWLAITSILAVITPDSSEADLVERTITIHAAIKRIQQAEMKANCQIKQLIEQLAGSNPASV